MSTPSQWLRSPKTETFLIPQNQLAFEHWQYLVFELNSRTKSIASQKKNGNMGARYLRIHFVIYFTSQWAITFEYTSKSSSFWRISRQITIEKKNVKKSKINKWRALFSCLSCVCLLSFLCPLCNWQRRHTVCVTFAILLVWRAIAGIFHRQAISYSPKPRHQANEKTEQKKIGSQLAIQFSYLHNCLSSFKYGITNINRIVYSYTLAYDDDARFLGHGPI